MDEKARGVLYKQLVEMSEINIKDGADPIISWQEFISMPEEHILKYVFDYRDKQTKFEVNGKTATYYIDLPNINLNGRDLRGTYISRFILSHEEGENNRTTSFIDLGSTNASINLTDVGYSFLDKTERGTDEGIIDFTNVDFRGCELFGMLDDEYSREDVTGLKKIVTVRGREHLDERYLTRRADHHLTEEQKAISDRAYKRFLNGETLYKMKGANSNIDLTDYDLTEIEDIKNFWETYADYKNNKNYNILITLNNEQQFDEASKYLNIIDYINLLDEQGLENSDIEKRIENVLNNLTEDDVMKTINTGKESYETVLYILLHRYYLTPKQKLMLLEKDFVDSIDLYEEELKCQWRYDGGWKSESYDFFDVINKILGEIENEMFEGEHSIFIKKIFDDFLLGSDKEEKALEVMLKKGDIDFLKENFNRYNKGEQEKVIHNRYEITKKIFEKNNIKFDKTQEEYRVDGIQDIFLEKLKNGDINFVKDNFFLLNKDENGKILLSLCRRGEIEFVKEHFKDIGEYKGNILKYLCQHGEAEFVKRNYDDNENDTYKKHILTELYEVGELDFIKEKFYGELPIEIKYEITRKVLGQNKIKFDKTLEEYEKEGVQDIFLEKFKNGEIEFVKENFFLLNKVENGKVLLNLCRRGEIEFVKEHFKDIGEYKGNILKYLCQHGEVEFVKRNYDDNENDTYKKHILKELYESGETDFIKEKFNDDLSVEVKYEITQKVFEKNNIKFDKTLEEYEEEGVQDIFLEKLRNGYIYWVRDNFYLLNNKIKVLQELGKKGETRFVEDSFMSLTSAERGVFLKEVSKQGDTILLQSCFDKITDKGEKNYILMMLANENQFDFVKRNKQYALSKKFVIKKFLEKQVGLNTGEIERFEETYKKYRIELETLSIERLEIKKEIFETCGAGRELFTTYPHVTMTNEDILYARLMFFKSHKIDINPDELEKTMGATNKKFANLYGAQLGILKDMYDDEIDYVDDVKRKLKKEYPMPKTKIELNRKLKEIEMIREV